MQALILWRDTHLLQVLSSQQEAEKFAESVPLSSLYLNNKWEKYNAVFIEAKTLYMGISK